MAMSMAPSKIEWTFPYARMNTTVSATSIAPSRERKWTNGHENELTKLFPSGKGSFFHILNMAAFSPEVMWRNPFTPNIEWKKKCHV